MTRDQVEMIVDKLDDLGYIRKGRISGDWYTIHCPFHGNGQEKKPSCGVLLVDQYKNGQEYKAGFWNCFACHHTGDMQKSVSEILKMRAVTRSGVDWLKENIPGFNPDTSDIDELIPSSLTGALIDKYAAESIRLRMLGEQKFVSEKELASYRFTVPYMYERKLTDAVIEKYDVGYDANHIPPGRSKPLPCVTFPVRDLQGRTLFFCRRSVVGKYFNYPQGVTKPVYGIYELPRDCSSVIVCESVFNALTAIVYGYNAVALMGTGNQYQLDQLRKIGVKEYVLCLDGDEAGRKGTEKLKRELSKVAIVWTIQMPADKDLNDCTKEEFDALYASRE